MSRRPIALSHDLQRLQNEGYDLDIRCGYLLVRDVPYANSGRAVRRGILISKLQLSGDVTGKPTDHVCYWTGEHPCHSDGSIIAGFQNSSKAKDLGDGLRADFTFSAKSDYRDHHHKMTTYIARIAGEAAKLDPAATACTFPAIPASDADSVFNYIDTASSRAGIGAVNAKIAGKRIGLVGLGGSGSYLLDFTAKTPVAEIHIFDRDVFSQHSAFRAPGAPTLEELQANPQKVARFTEISSRMRKGIITHDVFIDESNVALLDGLHFVFISIDVGPSKRVIVDHLVAKGTPFIDLGMGVTLEDGQLAGIVRATLSTPGTRELAEPHISYADGDGGANEYATNIQIAELNAQRRDGRHGLEEVLRILPRHPQSRVLRLLHRQRRGHHRRRRMTHFSRLQPSFLDLIPERLDPGILYISRRYSTASHLCCCGCGLEVVTPLNPAKWHLTEHADAVSLWPSVGNWSFPCHSHYWIARNQVHWAESMSAEMITAMKARDLRDVERLAPLPLPPFGRFRQELRAKWDSARALFLSWWHR